MKSPTILGSLSWLRIHPIWARAPDKERHGGLWVGLAGRHGAASAHVMATQIFQNPLVKGWSLNSLNHSQNPYMISGSSVNQEPLEHLGNFNRRASSPLRLSSPSSGVANVQYCSLRGTRPPSPLHPRPPKTKPIGAPGFTFLQPYSCFIAARCWGREVGDSTSQGC